jgi:hypothetical protein
MGLLRAYDNGKPVQIAAPLHIDFAGPKENEFVLVSGHPGSTDRLLTVAQLRYYAKSNCRRRCCAAASCAVGTSNSPRRARQHAASCKTRSTDSRIL